MKLFTISDLHLSFGVDKPMDIFSGWADHTERIRKNWEKIVGEEDVVVLPGDLSWGLKLEETLEDFRFLDSLPGKKYIIKGNHDLWWSTAKKLREFFLKNDIKSVDIIFNSAAVCGNYAIAGTRGWFYDNTGDKKVLLREAGRLEASIKQAKETGLETIVFLHYPPVYADYVCEEIVSVLKKYDIKTVYHGHIHSSGKAKAITEYEDIKFRLVSCDCVEFTPVFIP